jgi:hypothetical protein
VGKKIRWKGQFTHVWYVHTYHQKSLDLEM